jgi:hypothetical protein
MINSLFSAVIIIAVLVTALIIWMAIRKEKRHPLEMGQESRYTASVSGVIGWVRYRGPLIRVVVYDDFLIVSTGKQFIFSYADNIELEPCSFLFQKGFRIRHQNPDYPKRVEIWLKDRAGFVAATGGKIKVLS